MHSNSHSRSNRMLFSYYFELLWQLWIQISKIDAKNCQQRYSNLDWIFTSNSTDFKVPDSWLCWLIHNNTIITHRRVHVVAHHTPPFPVCLSIVSRISFGILMFLFMFEQTFQSWNGLRFVFILSLSSGRNQLIFLCECVSMMRCGNLCVRVNASLIYNWLVVGVYKAVLLVLPLN